MSISAAFLEVAKWQARVGLLTPLPTFCVPCSCCETQWSLCPSKRCCSYAPRVWLREQIKAYSLKTVLWCSALLGKIGGCVPCTFICVSALLRSPWRNPQHGPCFTKYRTFPSSCHGVAFAGHDTAPCLWCLCCAVLPVQCGLQACAVLHRFQTLQETQPTLPYRGAAPTQDLR